jgi:diaminohydroxyphosphoribosylaminopyrimidine deaminase/5-amino-6-(5-phosphoribosylamino)uracil reductase
MGSCRLFLVEDNCAAVESKRVLVADRDQSDAARGLFRLPGLTRMEQRMPLEITDLRRVGPALRPTARPASARLAALG